MAVCLLALVGMPLLSATAFAQQDSAIERGRYIFQLAGCQECHTQEGGKLLAGGRALQTPFGTFYSPNITPHPSQGIGRWQEADLRRALRHGRSPDGQDYYPVFPYPSYTGINDADISDLWAYLRTVPAVPQSNRAHQLNFPFSWRELMWGWKLLFFETGPFVADPSRTARWNRGAYLTRALGHCGECHSPRNLLGVVDSSRELSGNPDGPDESAVPNITPDDETGIGTWSGLDLESLLEMGMLPDADFVGSGMADVVDSSTSHLSAADQQAMIEFLQQLPAVYNPDFAEESDED